LIKYTMAMSTHHIVNSLSVAQSALSSLPPLKTGSQDWTPQCGKGDKQRHSPDHPNRRPLLQIPDNVPAHGLGWWIMPGRDGIADRAGLSNVHPQELTCAKGQLLGDGHWR
jgi:hypothetical protein